MRKTAMVSMTPYNERESSHEANEDGPLPKAVVQIKSGESIKNNEMWGDGAMLPIMVN